MGDRLRPIWDFDDLDATEQRLRALLGQEPSGSGRAEVLTQLARVEGLRGRYDDGERLVGEAEALAGSSAAARARVPLERGRLRRSSGDPGAALPLFESAFRIALEGDEEFLAADAAHMAALAAPDRDGRLAWTQRGLDLAGSPADPQVAYWLGPLLNNLGWEHYSAGEYEPALDAFQRALEVRERDSSKRAEIEIARYALGKTLRALGPGRGGRGSARAGRRVDANRREPDGWFHEELALDYAALGREADAREHAQQALPLLSAADPSFDGDPDRAARLRSLATALPSREPRR